MQANPCIKKNTYIYVCVCVCVCIKYVFDSIRETK